MPPRAQYYINTSREFYARARAYLAANDLLQTSEKGWGAAALRVKSVAELRGWRHTHHGELTQTIDRLVAETGDGQLKSFFNSANALHRNFYEGRWPRSEVRKRLARVGELLRRLENLSA